MIQGAMALKFCKWAEDIWHVNTLPALLINAHNVLNGAKFKYLLYLVSNCLFSNTPVEQFKWELVSYIKATMFANLLWLIYRLDAGKVATKLSFCFSYF